MKNFALAAALIFVAQVQAATLECSITEPNTNYEIEHAVDAGLEGRLFGTYSASDAVNGLGYAKVSVSAPHSDYEVTATLMGKKIRYSIKEAGKKIASGNATSGFMKGYRASYSNFHIDASEVHSPDITVVCSVK